MLLLAAEYPDVATVYPGHGLAGPHAVITQQAGYLATVRDLVARRLTPDAGLAPADKTAVFAELAGLFPGTQPVATLPDLADLNLDAVAGELAAEAAGA